MLYLFSGVQSVVCIPSLKRVQHPQAIPAVVRRNRHTDDGGSHHTGLAPGDAAVTFTRTYSLYGSESIDPQIRCKTRDEIIIIITVRIFVLLCECQERSPAPWTRQTGVTRNSMVFRSATRACGPKNLRILTIPLLGQDTSYDLRYPLSHRPTSAAADDYLCHPRIACSWIPSAASTGSGRAPHFYRGRSRNPSAVPARSVLSRRRRYGRSRARP